MKKIKLGDVCKINAETYSDSNSCDFVNYLDTSNITANHIENIQHIDITQEKLPSRARRKVKFNSIIYSTVRPNQRHYGIIKSQPENFLVSTGFAVIDVDPKKIDANFLYYQLSRDEIVNNLQSIAEQSTTAYPSIKPSDLSNLKFYVPSLDTQCKIGNFLYALDAKIALNKKINATLEAMAKTLYDYWFVQFDFPDENGKPYKTSGGKMIYNAELGRDIPVGWEIETLEGKISITRGISYSTETLSTDAEGIPMINLASIDRKRNYIPSGLKFFIGDVPNEKKLKSMDMLIACTDLTRQAEIIGSPILVINDREYTFSMDLARLTVTDEKLNELYLYMTLRTNFYHQYIVGFASGTTVLHLNTSGIEWYKVLIPPAVLQKKFAVVMNNIYLQTCKNICESQQLAELRDWLLLMLMNEQVNCK